MCLYPKIIKNRKYVSNKKNGGVIPAVSDERVKYVPIGCGNCMECRKQYARGWQVRLFEDIKKHRNGKFITFTFSDESMKELSLDKKLKGLEGYNLENGIATLAIRRFLERWRKKYKVSVRHWMITELGHNGTERIHLHGIIWTDESPLEIERIWRYGWVWKGKKVNDKVINYVSERTVNYVIKYVTKRDALHPGYKSIILCSPGIGDGYVKTQAFRYNSYKEGSTREHYRTETGHKIGLPIYWRNKRYSEEEREKLWLEKLDKLTRWVDGQEIDVSKNLDAYMGALKKARWKNKDLGFGDDSKNWNKIEYEKEQRNLRILEREKKKNKKEMESLRDSLLENGVFMQGADGDPNPATKAG